MTVVIYSIRKNSNIHSYGRNNSKQSENKTIKIYMKESKNYLEILGIISGIIISLLSLSYARGANTIANKDVEINEATNLPVFNLSILDNRDIFTDLSIINTSGIVSNVQIEIKSYLTIKLNYHTYIFYIQTIPIAPMTHITMDLILH